MSEEKKFLPTFKIYAPIKDVPWYVYYYDQEGVRRKKKGDINSYQSREDKYLAAERVIAAIRQQYIGNGHSNSDVKARVNRYLERKKVQYRRKTYLGYKSKVGIFFEWMENKRLKLTNENVIAFFEELQTKRHPTTHNVYYNILKKIFSDIGEKHLFDNISTIKEVKTPARYFQRHHIKLLKKYMLKKNPDLWLFVKFLYYCFIRPGETRHLRASDIFFDERKILVKGQFSKNHKTQFVAIPSAFYEDLLFIKELPPAQLLFHSPKDPSKPIGLNTMSRRHRVMLKELGFSKEYQLYSWKHTGAVELAKAGVRLKAIQLQLRHHSLDQTDEYLRQLGVDDFKELKELFPAI